MKRQIQGAAFAAAPFIMASAAHAQWSDAYTAPRTAVVDASGARLVEVEGGAGSLRVEGKPGLRQVEVNGTARASSKQYLSSLDATDGSGDMDVRNVTGSFTVESDGSGSIYATDIRGSVIVQNDGSGEIDVNKVGRDFKVESKGSGSIDYTAVTGLVDVPDREGEDR